MLSTVGFPNARGEAEYASDSSGRSFELSIAGVQELAGETVVVRVRGDLVGRMTVGPLGRAHLERQGRVPRMAAGNVVRVRTSAGRLVTYGTLHPDAD